MQVSKVMTQGCECIQPDASLQEAAQKMRDLDVGMLPVCGEDERLMGMITDRDITIRATAEGPNPAATSVEEVMTPEVIYCFEDQDVDEAANPMQQHQIRRLVVLNRDKRLVGVVSLGDLAVEVGAPNLSGKSIEKICQPGKPKKR